MAPRPDCTLPLPRGSCDSPPPLPPIGIKRNWLFRKYQLICWLFFGGDALLHLFWSDYQFKNGIIIIIIIFLVYCRTVWKILLSRLLNRCFGVASVQNGEFRDQSVIATPSSARRRDGSTLGSAGRVSQALQAQGAPVQVTKETAEGDKVAATGGWSWTAVVGDRAAEVAWPTRALGALWLCERPSGKLS